MVRVATRASLTAEYMALFRAVESSRPAGPRLFHDPYAAVFLRRWRKWILKVARYDAGRRLVERRLDRDLQAPERLALRARSGSTMRLRVFWKRPRNLFCSERASIPAYVVFRRHKR
jgi:O-methyltransferase involved in polyketide biosynthesis